MRTSSHSPLCVWLRQTACKALKNNSPPSITRRRASLSHGHRRMTICSAALVSHSMSLLIHRLLPSDKQGPGGQLLTDSGALSPGSAPGTREGRGTLVSVPLTRGRQRLPKALWLRPVFELLTLQGTWR